MPLFKCPKCNEMFIESMQMTVCPSCFYKGRLIEMKVSDPDDEEKKKRFSSNETVNNAMNIIRSDHADILNQKIEFSGNNVPQARKKIFKAFKLANIVTWKDLIDYHYAYDIRNLRGFGTYCYMSLAHLLCQTFMIEEIYK